MKRGRPIRVGPVSFIHKKKTFWRRSFLLVPGTGLEPALLSEHAPETCASTNSATRAGSIPSLGMNLSDLCPGQDLNLHRLWRLPPQSSVSTNSTTWALLLKAAFFSLKAGAKVQTFSDMAKYFFNIFINALMPSIIKIFSEQRKTMQLALWKDLLHGFRGMACRLVVVVIVGVYGLVEGAEPLVHLVALVAYMVAESAQTFFLYLSLFQWDGLGLLLPGAY